MVEPGVSYQSIYDELVRRGNKLMLDVTSGPPQGGMIGNALDKGAGYTPYFDHFGFSCGIEVVLGNGEILRTGDGALDHSTRSRTGTPRNIRFGPILDGLFAQSNYGIVTRMGVWLLPRPPAVRSFHFAFPDDDDLEADHRTVPAAEDVEFRADIVSRLPTISIFAARKARARNTRVAAARNRSRDEGRRRLARKGTALGAWNGVGRVLRPERRPRSSR